MMVQDDSSEEVVIKSMFIDFDKGTSIFYDNLYLDDYKIVVKTPIVCCKKLTETIDIKVKIEKFDLTKYAFLTSY